MAPGAHRPGHAGVPVLAGGRLIRDLRAARHRLAI
jgi:hypothetical protein